MDDSVYCCHSCAATKAGATTVSRTPYELWRNPMTSGPLPENAPVSQTNLIRLRMALGRLGRLLRQQNNDGLPYALISLIMTIHRLEPVTAKELAESEGVT